MDPSNGCLSLFPLLWKRTSPQRTVAGSCHKNLDVCPIFGIPSWLMPLRDRSGQSSQPHWHGVRGRSGRSLFKVCRELSPTPLPLPSPFLSLLSGVFLNEILRITIFFLWCVPGRLFVAGNTCSFLLSFLSSPSSLGVPGCCVIAGSPSFLVCPWMLAS